MFCLRKRLEIFTTYVKNYGPQADVDFLIQCFSMKGGTYLHTQKPNLLCTFSRRFQRPSLTKFLLSYYYLLTLNSVFAPSFRHLFSHSTLTLTPCLLSKILSSSTIDNSDEGPFAADTGNNTMALDVKAPWSLSMILAKTYRKTN